MPPKSTEQVEPNNAIYYPFINVPNSKEFLQVLLYWDKVYSIVPVEQLEKSFLYPHMRGYVQAGLVAQLRPMDFLFELPPQQYDEFFRFVQMEKKRVQRRLNGFDHEAVLIHAEKLNQYADEFVRMGLARPGDYPWYEMPRWLANRFMSFLAVSAGTLRSVRAMPITDQMDCYQMFAGRKVLDGRSDEKPVREVLFANLLPVPDESVNAEDLMEFKQAHWPQLKKFRRTIELETIRANAIPDLNERNRHVRFMIEELQEEKNEIAETMRKPFKISFGSLTALFSAAASVAIFDFPSLVSGGAALASGISQTASEQKSRKEKPLTYAAFADKRFSIIHQKR